MFILKPVLLFCSSTSIPVYSLERNLASFLKEKESKYSISKDKEKKFFNLYATLGLEVENNQMIS